MRFFKWVVSCYYTRTGKVWLIRLPIDRFNGVCFGWDCIPIQEWDQNFAGTFPGRDFIHVDFQPSAVTVISDRLRECVETATTGEVQFLPLRLVSDEGDGDPIQGYFLAHVLHCLDCIDREHTQVANGDWTRMSSGGYQVRGPITFRREAVKDHRIFRVDGSRVQVYIREDIKVAIESQGLTGSRFQEVDVV